MGGAGEPTEWDGDDVHHRRSGDAVALVDALGADTIGADKIGRQSCKASALETVYQMRDFSQFTDFLKHQKVGPWHFVYVEAVDGVLGPVLGHSISRNQRGCPGAC